MLRRKAILKVIFILCLALGGFLYFNFAIAQDTLGLEPIEDNIALSADDPRIVAAKIVRVALGFLGIVALAIVLYGGFLWMTSAGNEETINKAKRVLVNGLIGLIIILMAFAITQFVLNSLLGRVDDGAGGGAAGPPLIGRYSGALGNGIIESHYPPRGGVGIPRNTKIIVTFKEQMSLETLINNYDDGGTPENLADDTVLRNNNGTPDNPEDDWMEINNENIRIFKSSEGEFGAERVPNFLSPEEVRISFTPDLKNFVFDPIGLLGSPAENTWYTTALKPGIEKADGEDAFLGAFRDGYAWDFEVSTLVDTTPPRVESVIPREDTLNPRNIIVQINFNEAMDPTTVSGSTDGDEALRFNNILTTFGEDGENIPGTWSIGNEYRTVEFITNDECGRNSCGGTVYCLPGDSTINVLAIAARLGDSPPEAELPYDGMVDVCGNSLDGNSDGRAEGYLEGERESAGGDNYSWFFRTNNTIDLVPPRIDAVNPEPRAESVAFGSPIELTFTKLMSITSFTSSNIILQDNQRDECAVWFTLRGINLQEDGTPVLLPDDVAIETRASIVHENLLPTGGVCSDGDPVVGPLARDGDGALVNYYPMAKSDVKDLFQNCFFEPVGPAGGNSCVLEADGEFPEGCQPWED